MTLQPTHSEISVLGTTASAFLPLGGNANVVYGLHITPVLFFNNQSDAVSGSSRGISSDERRARIAANPARAAALAEGRLRLAKAWERVNGVRNLASLRLAAKLSQADLAEKMNMKQPNIARLEKKPGDPSLSTLQGLASALGVSLSEVASAIDETNRRLSLENE